MKSQKNFLELWFSIKGILLSILFVSTVGSMCYFISLCKKHIKILTKIKETITNGMYKYKRLLAVLSGN